MSIYFSKKQLAVQLPAEIKKRGLQSRVSLSVAFHNGLHRGADVRTVGRKLCHNQTKFFRIDALLKFLTHGVARAPFVLWTHEAHFDHCDDEYRCR